MKSNMSVKEVKFWYWIVNLLPKRIIYFCFMHVMAYSTTGKYGKTVVPDLSGMEAIKRYENAMKKAIVVLLICFWILPAYSQEMVTITRTAVIQGAGETLLKFPFSDSKYPGTDAEIFLIADTTSGIFGLAAGLDIESKPWILHSNAIVVSTNDSTAVLANFADSLRADLMFNFEMSSATLDGDGLQLGFTTLTADTFALTVIFKYAKNVLF